MGKVQTSLRFGIMLAAVGGFLDAYSYLHAGGVFAGAQSGNTVMLAIHLAGQDWSPALRTLVPIASFVAGSAIGAGIQDSRIGRLSSRPGKVALVLEILLLLLALVPPLNSSNVLLTVLLSLAAGIQMAVFRKVHDWSYSTTVTTNNFTKWTQAIVDVVTGHDTSARPRAAAFTAIIASFVGGAVIASLLTLRFDAVAILGAASILLVCLVWLMFSE